MVSATANGAADHSEIGFVNSADRVATLLGTGLESLDQREVELG
jgi:hypothetical protein